MDQTRRNLLIGAGALGATALAGESQAHGMNPNGGGVVLSPDGWDAEAPPELLFLTEARVQVQTPPTTTGAGPNGQGLIFNVTGGTIDGPHIRGRVTNDAAADWVHVRPDGVGVLDVRFTWETHDNALIYVQWLGRFWSRPEDAEYAADVAKADDPDGAWRYYFRAAPRFETGDPRYAWLNNIVAVSKSRTGNGGPIHRFYAVL
ncbi:hypothetical protein GCM10007385_14910 [Tateyamaria omphalii]|uniref:DUF3237 domain-containing protein n=1 Tax=Tateyamaria omphalii TaxID=299262 RepID=UPI001673DB2A|nr:DUF3237 domain-containing protein [Tateyamaria omphalii]GGX48114.1 hypothetical protein GCM10007385_14910 [Tateyamaria omphalii]